MCVCVCVVGDRGMWKEKKFFKKGKEKKNKNLERSNEVVSMCLNGGLRNRFISFVGFLFSVKRN